MAAGGGADPHPLAELHEVLQAAFGWWGYHLHEFDIDGVRYGSDDGEDWDPLEDERRARLDKLARAGSSFTYTYDFGDNWRHTVTVEKIPPADPSMTYPVCTGGRRARPPEDCGGVSGYENVLAVLADPADGEHASMLEWVGGSFDPERFRNVRVRRQPEGRLDARAVGPACGRLTGRRWTRVRRARRVRGWRGGVGR